MCGIWVWGYMCVCVCVRVCVFTAHRRLYVCVRVCVFSQHTQLVTTLGSFGGAGIAGRAWGVFDLNT